MPWTVAELLNVDAVVQCEVIAMAGRCGLVLMWANARPVSCWGRPIELKR